MSATKDIIKVGGSVIHRGKNGGVIANFHRFGDLDFRFFTVFSFHPQAALFIAIFCCHVEGNAHNHGPEKKSCIAYFYIVIISASKLNTKG